MAKSFEAALRPGAARAGRWRRVVAPLVGVVAAAGLAACEPPPAPDGRDLAMVLDSAPPVRVDKGTEVVLTGVITNHGTASAGEVTVVYAVTGGFTVDLDLGSAATCTSVSPVQVGCAVADALAPGASLPFTVRATAGEVSGAYTHVLGTGSDGTEPKPDTNPGYTVFTTDVRPPAADPAPVAIGGDANYLGTGSLLEAARTGRPNEGVMLAVNPYCTDKANGDRYQSGYDGGTCSGVINPAYRSSGYTYAIDVPAGRTSAIDVLLWDARYNDDDLQLAATGETCTSAWGPAVVLSEGQSVELTGPALVQYPTGSPWGPAQTIPDGTTITVHGWARYSESVETCTPTYGTEPGIDNQRQAGQETFTFTLHQADSTPSDPSDNPVICTQSFDHDTPFDPGSFLGSARWNRLCSIQVGQPSGEYLLRVHNSGAISSPEADGTNLFGIVAALASAGGDPVSSLCDRATTPECPVVRGAGEASLSIHSDTQVARIPLGGVDGDQEGRLLRLELFDPGEGMASIRLLAPTGVDTWAPMPFTWSAAGMAGSGSTTTDLDVRQSRFNGKVVTIEVDLARYAPAPGNDRWLVEYVAHGDQQVTDRTTWDAAIVDQP